MKVRRKPIEFNAIQFVKPYSKVIEACPSLQLIRNGNRVVFGIIPTKGGNLRVEIGDWLIFDLATNSLQHAPCNSDVFNTLYDVIDRLDNEE